jgi:membrane protein implicated in regulation of membrane protease activity
MAMIEWIQSMGPETWAILGITLIILEIFSPTSFLLWPGLAALGVALSLIFYPISWQLQFIGFALLSLAFTLIGRRFYNPNQITSDEPELNLVGRRYIGHIYPLAEDSQNGRARVKIGDSLWLAEIEGEGSLKAGTPVEVIEQHDTILTVKKHSQ